MVAIARANFRRRMSGPNFAGLMTMFDVNFRLLGWLVPPDGDVFRSRAEGSPDLFSEVLERHAYTTELRLTYCFTGEDGGVIDPDARLRIYHDAKQAEILHCRPGRSFRRLHGPWVPSPDELHRRWTLNRFLYKWLDYLLDQGHGVDTFRPVNGIPGPAEPIPETPVRG